MGAEAAGFGDIDIEQNRQWEEERCKNTGLIPSFPLWQRGREKNVYELIDLGYKCLIKSINMTILPKTILGKYIDDDSISVMKFADIDICGENGEYHTLVVDGPIFKKSLDFYIGDIIEFGDYAVAEIRCLENWTNLEFMEENEMDLKKFKWTHEPENYKIYDDKIEITTTPHTDLWQRTYYHFQNDNAPVLQIETDEKYFSFIVKTDFNESHHRFDQCGIVMYLDSENWLKASIEYENNEYQHLGSVVTNHGYSDWATTVIDASIKSMWYRFSRREDDYCIECSYDGVNFSQMRICHMFKGNGKITFGIYACSPEDSSFKAIFTHMQITDCQWKSHEGQKPDKDC